MPPEEAHPERGGQPGGRLPDQEDEDRYLKVAVGGDEHHRAADRERGDGELDVQLGPREKILTRIIKRLHFALKGSDSMLSSLFIVAFNVVLLHFRHLPRHRLHGSM